MQTTRTQRALLSATALMLLATATLANSPITILPDTSNPDTLPIRQPDRSITIPGCDQTELLGISPDGRTALVADQYPTINITSTIISTVTWRSNFWGAIPAAISLFIGYRIVSRTLRNRREIGQPHCSKCNYQLTGNTSGQCPECGQEITKKTTVIGKPIRLKLCIVIITCLILPTAYCFTFSMMNRYYIGRYIRKTIPSSWSWDSSTLYQWKQQNPQFKWLGLHTFNPNRVRPLNLVAGEYLDSVHESYESGYHIFACPFNSTFALTDGLTMLLWDQTSGKITNQINAKHFIDNKKLFHTHRMVYKPHSYWENEHQLYIHPSKGYGNDPDDDYFQHWHGISILTASRSSPIRKPLRK